jgi:hypothetical protein
MRTYQHSRLASAQSCSQSASDDERALAALPFAAYKQLWLTYKAVLDIRFGCLNIYPETSSLQLRSLFVIKSAPAL